MTAFPSEEAFEQWFVGRYGHHTRDWHDDRGLPYPGDEPAPTNLTAKRAATREKIERLAAESPFEGERASAQARLAAFDAVDAARIAELERSVGFGYRGPAPTEQAHAATERGSYYARDTLASDHERGETDGY